MQINADAACLVRTQFQQRIALRQRCRARFALDPLLPQSGHIVANGIETSFHCSLCESRTEKSRRERRQSEAWRLGKQKRQAASANSCHSLLGSSISLPPIASNSVARS